MRRLLVPLGVLALALPVTGLAARGDLGDGTLSVRDGKGTFVIGARGGIVGSFTHGSVTVTDPDPTDGTVVVSGDDWSHDKTDTVTVYGGTNVRFRLIGGKFRLRVQGVGVNISLVGKGQVILRAKGTDDDGSYSVNGDAWTPVPDYAQFPLSASSP